VLQARISTPDAGIDLSFDQHAGALLGRKTRTTAIWGFRNVLDKLLCAGEAEQVANHAQPTDAASSELDTTRELPIATGDLPGLKILEALSL
jgi:hypothetical protein